MNASISLRNQRAFTLVELLTVVAIIVALMALSLPAITALKGSNSITASAYDIAGTLQGARAYAMANNTYVWVGFYEEDTTAGAPAVPGSPVTPTAPYTGIGRVILATMASKDGSTIIDDSASGTTELTAASLTPIRKLIKLEGIHLTDLGAPSGGDAKLLAGRPATPYTGSFSTQNRISSDNTEKTRRPFVAQNYVFSKTVRYNPRGEANINSTYEMRRVAEVGIRPTHGVTVDTATPNIVAIQFTGVGGGVKIYRP